MYQVLAPRAVVVTYSTPFDTAKSYSSVLSGQLKAKPYMSTLPTPSMSAYVRSATSPSWGSSISKPDGSGCSGVCASVSAAVPFVAPATAPEWKLNVCHSPLNVTGAVNAAGVFRVSMPSLNVSGTPMEPPGWRSRAA